MLLARVIGTVVATQKDPRLEGKKLLVVQGLDEKGGDTGGTLVAIDTVQAGVGSTVLIVRGSSARLASGLNDLPVDAAIVGIVDTIHLNET